jgi:hypothetical protein
LSEKKPPHLRDLSTISFQTRGKRWTKKDDPSTLFPTISFLREAVWDQTKRLRKKAEQVARKKNSSTPFHFNEMVWAQPLFFYGVELGY